MPVTRYQYCCGCLPIFSGIFAIALHSFIHGIYGICLILTTYYSPENEIVNYMALTGYLCLVLIGMPILWVVVFQMISGIKFMAVSFVILSLFNFACAIAYFIEYFSFRANSLLDKVFLWRYGSTWVDSNQLPFSIWHLLTGLLIALTPLWFYYGYVIFTFIKYLRVLASEEIHIPEIVILDNRMGAFGYRPPEGYPYSTNQPPQILSDGQYIQVYQPYPAPTRQADNNPKSILD